MLIIAATALGMLVGLRRAVARGGNAADRAQYAAVHAIAFGLVGLFIAIAIGRLA